MADSYLGVRMIDELFVLNESVYGKVDYSVRSSRSYGEIAVNRVMTSLAEIVANFA